jgi:hypothetical protein
MSPVQQENHARHWGRTGALAQLTSLKGANSEFADMFWSWVLVPLLRLNEAVRVFKGEVVHALAGGACL